ncbi:MAG: nucleoside-diphosphate kinase [Candidatus Moranbacteria bacterium]|nr:nucleoside-diphosphate kinase [Candidatus Moranbacteria bacterium]
MEQTLVIIKPDGLQRNLIGEIISRFERKGLKIAGMKMMSIDDLKVEEHYKKYVEKPFFRHLRTFMQSSPVIVMVLEGVEAVSAVRLIAGSTKGREADAGTIRGDLAMSLQTNLVHISDPEENPQEEIDRFFSQDELFDYKKIDRDFVYSPDELD